MVEESLTLLSKPWQKFFKRFQEIEELKISKWQPIHHLAYICKRYKNYYGMDFAFSLNGSAPSKCTEIVLVKKMCAMLGTTNQRIIKEYVDWVLILKLFQEK